MHARSFAFQLILKSLYVSNLFCIFNFFYETYRFGLTQNSKCRGSMGHGDLKFWFSGISHTDKHCLLFQFHISYQSRCIMSFRKIADTSFHFLILRKYQSFLLPRVSCIFKSDTRFQMVLLSRSKQSFSQFVEVKYRHMCLSIKHQFESVNSLRSFISFGISEDDPMR